LGVSVGFDFVIVFETLQEKHYAMQHYANLDATSATQRKLANGRPADLSQADVFTKLGRCNLFRVVYSER